MKKRILTPKMKFSAIFFLGIVFGSSIEMDSTEQEIYFPATVTSSIGNDIDVAVLAKTHIMIVITIKATWCPVCRQQLLRIKEQLGDFEKCNVSFLVISPGTNETVQEVKFNTEFPFTVIPDQNFSIAKKLELILSPEEIMPAIIILNKDLSIKWIRKGRNALNFGDEELKDYLGCANWI